MASSSTNKEATVSLRIWMENDANKPTENIDFAKNKRESIIRRTTIAYGIVELLKRCTKLKDDEIRIDNFEVTVAKEVLPSRPWDDINGVGMISSGASLMIEEPSYLSALNEDENTGSDGEIVGRCLEVELITSLSEDNNGANTHMAQTETAIKNYARDNYLAGMNALNALAAVAENSNRCHLFARILYELFTNQSFPDDAAMKSEGPPQKRVKTDNNLVLSRKQIIMSRAQGDDVAAEPFQIPCIARMQAMGTPSSICLMTQNLLESALRGSGGQSDDAYESLAVVGKDLHLLLLDPDRFLFDNDVQDISRMKLLYRCGKLYGRDKEEALITDAFCRVSRGKSEAFFIGGFSGSGKSMLVNSLRDRVHCVGGYTIKHKFDAISQEEPLSGVISAFNRLCLLIKGNVRPVIAKRLEEEFGEDFSLFLRLLPNVRVLFPDLNDLGNEMENVITMTPRSVSFTLLRFVRVVSSPRHPIMLFLDDIQWADSTALDVIHTILSDTMGSCMFFVGAYRNNEVNADHDIFDLMKKLEASNVEMTKLSLNGLNEEDLNTMLSDALCLYPRICRPLSSIVHQKTKGNPFFVLEFMQSLQSCGLLTYNCHQKRWMWNEDILRGVDITDNVLHLLASKMVGLSDDVQTLLKAMACFGTRTNEKVIDYLSESPTYGGIKAGLDRALHDGYIEKDGGGCLKFVHDKVREAAYNLIPEGCKKKFHYDLGKVLYSVCEGKDIEDSIIFPIVSQINYGMEWLVKDNDLRITIAELNTKAGEIAIDGCDHKTAYSYLGAGLSLLPDDHWESHYDLSLRLNFMMAKAADSFCHYEDAEVILHQLFKKARCLDDKLPSYLLLNEILLAEGKPKAAYDTCTFVLRELGETIPDSVTSEMAGSILRETLAMYDAVYGDEWLVKQLEDETIRTIALIYNKAVQLSLQNGTCQYTPLALIHFAGYAMKDKIPSTICRVAKNAMTLQKRFEAADQLPEFYLNFYGRIAWRFEPLQVCADKARRAFEAALSLGKVDIAFYCSVHVIKYSFLSGTNLKSVLKEIDYFLHLLKTYKKEFPLNFLLIFRETASLLIDNGKETSIEATPSLGDLDDPGNKLRESLIFHKAIQSFWVGHTDRCRYHCEKCAKVLGPLGQLNGYTSRFFHGITSIAVLKKKNASKEKGVIRAAIGSMKELAASSEWNFLNKLHLLEAEQQCLRQYHRKALESYDASIEAAKKSGFVHEQGLACEKAAFYLIEMGKGAKALEYFSQAWECYKAWGSNMKVAFIRKELNNLTTF